MANNNKNIWSEQEKRWFQEEKKHTSLCEGRAYQEEEGATTWVVENVAQINQNEPLLANHPELIIFLS